MIGLDHRVREDVRRSSTEYEDDKQWRITHGVKPRSSTGATDGFLSFFFFLAFWDTDYTVQAVLAVSVAWLLHDKLLVERDIVDPLIYYNLPKPPT